MSQYQNDLINELESLKKERSEENERLEAEKESFASEITSHLGNDIKQVLSEEKAEKKPCWLKNFVKKLIRTCS